MPSDLRPCPRCSAVYPEQTVVCTRCGIDLRTGKPITSQIESEPEPTEPTWIRKLPLVFAACFPGLFRPVLLLTSLVAMVLGIGLMMAGVVLVVGLMVVLSGFAVSAGGFVLYAHAAAWLICGEFNTLPNLMIDFDSTRWNLFLLLVAVPIVGLSALMMFGGASGS